jgi:DNA-binding NarL/FixJ family response regulator
MDILLIEDNAYRRVTILKYLLRCGHRVTPCSSVDEAEELLGFVSSEDSAGDVVIVARELMREGGARLHDALSERMPQILWVLLPADRGVAWLAERLEHRGLEILLIEADDDRRSAMIAHMADRGDRVTACRSVGDAREALADAAHAPHAIISDVHLRDGDGLSFYLAATRRFPDIRWIVTSRPQVLPAIA